MFEYHGVFIFSKMGIRVQPLCESDFFWDFYLFLGVQGQMFRSLSNNRYQLSSNPGQDMEL